MKKILGLAIVLALVTPAKADILKNLKTTGEIQVLGEMVNPGTHEDSSSNYSNTSVRVLFGLGFDLTQDVKANMTLAYYNMWGQEATSPTGASASTHAGNTVDNYLNSVTLIEGNIVLKNLFCCLEAKIGRQFYGDEDSAIIFFGPNHYNSAQKASKQAQSLDGVKLSYAGEMVAWDAIYSKLNDTDNPYAVGGADADGSLLGLDVKARFNDNLKAQAYFYQFRNAQNTNIGLVAAETPKYVGIYGIKPSLTVGDLKLSLEYARNVGGETAFDYDHGDLWKVDASLDLGAFTPRAQMARGSHFQSFGNYRPGLIIGQGISNFGFVDTLGVYEPSVFDDMLVYNLGTDMQFASFDKFNFSVDGFMFYDRNMKGSPTYEADLWVKYSMNSNVELHVAGGFLHDHGEDNAYKAQSGVIVRF